MFFFTKHHSASRYNCFVCIAFGRTRFLSRTLTVTFLALFTSKHATMFWIRAIILHGINGFFFIPSVPFLVSFLQCCIQPLPLLLTHPPKLPLNHIHLYFPINCIRKEKHHLPPVLHLSVEVRDINYNFCFIVFFCMNHHSATRYTFFVVFPFLSDLFSFISTPLAHIHITNARIY